AQQNGAIRDGLLCRVRAPSELKQIVHVRPVILFWLDDDGKAQAAAPAFRAASRSSRARLRSTPQAYSESEPSLRTTRWHGMAMARLFAAHAAATARAPCGDPMRRAISAYQPVPPTQIPRSACHTRCWKAV